MVTGVPSRASYRASKSLCCVGQDLLQRVLSLLLGIGADHLAEGGDALRLKEHMLGAAQTDALRAQLTCLLGVARAYRRWYGRSGGGTRLPSP